MSTTKFSTIEAKLRRVLRDPDAKVFSSNLIMDAFNRSIERLAKDTEVLEDVVGIHWPPQADYGITQQWEKAYVKGYIRWYGLHSERDNFRCSYLWEIEQKAGYTPDSTDGVRVTVPWEGYIDDVADTLGTIMDRDLATFPHDFESPIMVVYDNERLEPIHEDQAKSGDDSYRTSSGTPLYYYRVGETEFAPMPKPSEVSWVDIDITVNRVDYGYSHSWEEDYVDDLSSSLGKVSANYDGSGTATNAYSGNWEYLYSWEKWFAEGDTNYPEEVKDAGLHATHSFGQTGEVDHGLLNSVSGTTTLGEYGITKRWDGVLTQEEYGTTVDYCDLADSLGVVYKQKATRVSKSAEKVPVFPDWMIKYAEKHTLGLLYQSNTDAYDETKSNWWFSRYTHGLQQLRRYKGARLKGRRPRLKTTTRPRFPRRYVRMPDAYPRIPGRY